MKKLLIILISLTSIVNAQSTNWDFIKDVKPITWTKEVISKSTTHIDGNKMSGTIASGGIGHILTKGSLLGTLGGAVVGNAISNSDNNITTNTINYVQVTGYQVITNKGTIFKTFEPYIKYQVINLNKIKKE